MKKIKNITYQQKIEGKNYDPRLYELAQESGDVYSKSLKEWWKVFDENKVFMSKYDLEKHMKDKITRKHLHSDSSIGSIQLAYKSISNYFKAKKEYEKNPCKFSGKPMPPTREKFLSSIIFKKSAIRIKYGFLLLSLSKEFKEKTLKFRWSLEKPKYVTINYNPSKGWMLNCVFKQTTLQLETLDKEKMMSVDLGNKRIASTFNGEETKLYSGKYMKSLIRLENKVEGKTKSKLSNYKKGSKHYKKIQRAKRKVKNKINNKKKDFLHKTSKIMVDDCIKNNIGKVVFGDCSNIHNETNLGKVNNQQIQQNPEQRLRKYFTEKFERIGGQTAVVSEKYTSQTCPKCKHRHKCQDRNFICPNCDFVYDRDGVGCINIYTENVFNNVSFEEKNSLNVAGSLSLPIGVKYQDCPNFS